MEEEDYMVQCPASTEDCAGHWTGLEWVTVSHYQSDKYPVEYADTDGVKHRAVSWEVVVTEENYDYEKGDEVTVFVCVTCHEQLLQFGYTFKPALLIEECPV